MRDAMLWMVEMLCYMLQCYGEVRCYATKVVSEDQEDVLEEVVMMKATMKVVVMCPAMKAVEMNTEMSVETSAKATKMLVVIKKATMKVVSILKPSLMKMLVKKAVMMKPEMKKATMMKVMMLTPGQECHG